MTEPDESPSSSVEAMKRKIAEFRRTSATEGHAEEVREKGRRDPTANAMFGHVIDLFSGFLVGTGAGYVLDRQLATLPVFLILGMLLGVASGFFMIYKSVSRNAASSGEGRKNQN